MNARTNAINQMHAAVAQAEVRVAKDLQEFWPDWSWTKCLREAKIIVSRHGINITIVKE